LADIRLGGAQQPSEPYGDAQPNHPEGACSQGVIADGALVAADVSGRDGGGLRRSGIRNLNGLK